MQQTRDLTMMMTKAYFLSKVYAITVYYNGLD
jgi:hypothetical protein